MEGELRVLVIGDPHFKSDNAIDTDKLELETVKLIENRNINACVVLGDVMHDHGFAKMRVFNRACQFLFTITKLLGKSNTFVLIGNHDRINNKISDGDEHFFKWFKDNPEFPTVVDSFTKVKLSDKTFGLAPYIEPGRLFEYVKHSDDISTYFFHQEMKGCRLALTYSDKGDKWPLDYPLAVSGHIHEYQTPQPNLIYPGTPFQVAFGCPQNKTVMILSYQDGIQTPEIERVALNIPKKINITLNCQEFEDFLVDDQNDWIKFKICDSKSRIKALKKGSKYSKLKLNPLIKFSFTALEDKPEEILTGGKMKSDMTKASFKIRLESCLLSVKEEIRTLIKELH